MPEYVNRGPDPRPLGVVGAWVQQRLSFHSTTPPKQLKLGFATLQWPPFLAVAIPYPPKKYATFRIGWRWDQNWGSGGYISDVILKLAEEMPHL